MFSPLIILTNTSWEAALGRWVEIISSIWASPLEGYYQADKNTYHNFWWSGSLLPNLAISSYTKNWASIPMATYYMVDWWVIEAAMQNTEIHKLYQPLSSSSTPLNTTSVCLDSGVSL